MPCRDAKFTPGFHPTCDGCRETAKKLNELTALLCELCGAIDAQEQSERVRPVKLPPDVRLWWQGHRKFDESRRSPIERRTDTIQCNQHECGLVATHRHNWPGAPVCGVPICNIHLEQLKATAHVMGFELAYREI